MPEASDSTLAEADEATAVDEAPQTVRYGTNEASPALASTLKLGPGQGREAIRLPGNLLKDPLAGQKIFSPVINLTDRNTSLTCQSFLFRRPRRRILPCRVVKREDLSRQSASRIRILHCMPSADCMGPGQIGAEVSSRPPSSNPPSLYTYSIYDFMMSMNTWPPLLALFMEYAPVVAVNDLRNEHKLHLTRTIFLLILCTLRSLLSRNAGCASNPARFGPDCCRND